MYRLLAGGSSKKDKAKKQQDEGFIREKPPKKPKKKKKKKKHSADGKGERKKKKIKKMRMRLMGKKNKKSKKDPDFVGQDDGPDDGEAIRLPPTTIDQQYGAYGGASPGGGIGGSASGMGGSGDNFQLDNVSPGMRRSEDVRRLGGPPSDEANKKFRVKPFHAFPAPLYLNETELYQNMMVASDEFEFLSSYLDPSTKSTRRAKVPEIVRKHFGSPKEDGRVGSLRVEVLGCVGVDRAKPDISVYLVVGDCAFMADIITGERSPMWPYSSKRAAVFPLIMPLRDFFWAFLMSSNERIAKLITFAAASLSTPPRYVLTPNMTLPSPYVHRHSFTIDDHAASSGYVFPYIGSVNVRPLCRI